MSKEAIMKDNRYANEWLDNLEAFMKGETPPSADDADIAHVATRLASALAPLREMAQTRQRVSQRSPSHVHARYSKLLENPRRRLARSPLLFAALLLLTLVTGVISTGGLARMEEVGANAKQVWHTSTSLDQINGISIESFSPPHPGLKPLPLLPATLPARTQAPSYGVLTDASNPDVLTTFVANYRIAGQDVLLYEQPTDIPLTSTIAQTVQIGDNEGQLFQDEQGNHALQWYQNGMLCQITSKLPVARLIMLASVIEPIKSWDLIR
jgi:hypothetical protein